MRQCPKCEYVDPPYWRHSKWSYWIDFTEYEHFEELHPDLCPLKAGEKTEDEFYVYRRMKSGIRVERKAKVDYESMGWMEGIMESVNHHSDIRPYWKIPTRKITDFLEFKENDPLEEKVIKQ